MVLPLPVCTLLLVCFFFNETATTEIYTLSLHDALPIWTRRNKQVESFSRSLLDCHSDRSELKTHRRSARSGGRSAQRQRRRDRKSTRLNSSHVEISYAVFCLKKKKK